MFAYRSVRGGGVVTVGSVAALQEWSRGNFAVQAAVELLIRAFNGRFAHPGNPWIQVEPDGTTWVDWTVINPTTNALSGGERRFLSVVASLGGGEPVNLKTALDFDSALTDLVLAAIAQTAWAGRLHPWPAEQPPV